MSVRQIFVRTQRTIGGIQLDAVINEGHENTVTITKSPVEGGADITDHAIVQPKKVNLRGVVSDSPLGVAAFGQLVDQVTRLFGTSTLDNLTRTQQAYESFIQLMEAREPIEIVTGLRVYPAMLITKISTNQDKDTSKIVNLNIACEEIVLTESVTLDIPESAINEEVRKSASNIVDKGKEELEPVLGDREQTTLKALADWLQEGS